MAGSKFNFAIAALIEIQKSGSTGPIGAREIAEATGLSKRYLEQVLGFLKKAGIVTSIRGKHGGYELAISPDRLQLSDIWRATGEDISVPANEAALAVAEDGFSGTRAIAAIWKDLYDVVTEYMESQTLRSVALLDLDREDMYYI
jgi:Rrf2 family protein